MRRRLTALAVVLAAAVAGLGLNAWLGGGEDRSGSALGSGGTGALPVAVAPAGGATAFDPDTVRADPGGQTAVVARGRSRVVAVFASPSGTGRPARRIARTTAEGRALPVVFSVLDRRGGWLRVALPVRPVGARGWVRARDVALTRTAYRIEIRRSAHRLVLYERDRVVLRAPIAVGRAVSPTPRGRYFVTDLLRPPDPRGFYGPFALGLSAYSPVYTSFAGGDGQVGIHGTNRPAVLGRDVSHGCVRVANAVVTRLARTVPLGTPVVVRA